MPWVEGPIRGESCNDRAEERLATRGYEWPRARALVGERHVEQDLFAEVRPHHLETDW